MNHDFAKPFAAVLIFMIASLCHSQEDALNGRIVDIGNLKLHYYTQGSGSQTIVVDVGIGESYKHWLPLLEKMAKKARVFGYDRAGYGDSEMGPLPRNCEREADELRRLLIKAKVKGPYLLVGHSLGALNLQVFAKNNMKNVSGILLLDPPPLDWLSGDAFPELRKMADEQTSDFEKTADSMINRENTEGKKQAGFYRTIASEHREMFSSSAEQARSIKSFGDMPLIVIASGRPNESFAERAMEFQAYWNEQCRLLAAKSSKGKYWLASDSSHHIHRDDPEIVLKAIEELLIKGKG